MASNIDFPPSFAAVYEIRCRNWQVHLPPELLSAETSHFSKWQSGKHGNSDERTEMSFRI